MTVINIMHRGLILYASKQLHGQNVFLRLWCDGGCVLSVQCSDVARWWWCLRVVRCWSWSWMTCSLALTQCTTPGVQSLRVRRAPRHDAHVRNWTLYTTSWSWSAPRYEIDSCCLTTHSKTYVNQRCVPSVTVSRCSMWTVCCILLLLLLLLVLQPFNGLFSRKPG